jgi:hypothetical protein
MRTTRQILMFGLLAATLAVAPAAHSGMSITWGATAGFSICDPRDPIFSGGQTTRVILVYSSDAVRDWPDSDTGVGGSDVVLAGVNLDPSAAGSRWGDFVWTNYNAAYVPGYVYGRVFSSTRLGVYTLFYDGPIVAIQNVALLDLPQVYDMNPSMLSNDVLEAYLACIPCGDPCPEPLTVSVAEDGVVSVHTETDQSSDYTLEYTTNLLDGTWQFADSVTNAGLGGHTFTNGPTNSRRFYRVMKDLYWP